jgi:glycosyltransferase involved in cell wall biosynthesis
VEAPVITDTDTTGQSARTPRRVVMIRPRDGGVAFVAASEAAELSRRGDVTTQLVGNEAGAPALDGLRTAWRHRREIRDADVVHLELGLTALGAFWIGAWASLVRTDLVTVLHDGPSMVKSPGSGAIRNAPGWRDAVAHKVFARILDRPLRALVRGRTRRWVVLTDQSRRDLERVGMAPVVVVPIGADPPIATRPPSECTTVVFAGYIVQSKGIDGLLDAWEQVGPSSGLRLQIVGDHRRHYVEYAASLRARVESSMVATEWIGKASEEELQSLIADAALVVLPYLKSNPASGIVVRALVEGRAVVATSVPAFTTVIENGITGVLVEPGDVHTLASTIAELLDDEVTRDRLGKAAATWAADHCTWAAQVDALEIAYAKRT